MFHNTNRTKYNKKFKILTLQNTKEQNTNCQNTFVTKYKCNKIQMGQNTNITKYKHSKIQTRQNTKEQNTNCQNTNVTKYKLPKYKCNKIQMQQNTT